MICVHSISSQHLATTSLTSPSHDSTPEFLTRILTFEIIVFRVRMQLLLKRLVLPYTYTAPVQTLHTGLKILKVTLLNAFSLVSTKYERP